MIILDATTKSLQALLTAAVTTTQLHYVLSYVEIDNAAPSLTPSSNVGNTSDTTAVTLVAAPASSKQRQVKFLSVYNADSAAAEVTVRYNSNGTFYTIVKITLLAGEQLQYTVDNGWVVLDSNGGVKSTQVQPASQFLKGSFDAGNITDLSVLTSGTAFATYLGICARTSSSIDLQYRLSVASISITWAELGIFKGPIVIGGNPSLSRLGFADISGAGPNTVGIKTINVALTTPAQPGDELWAVIGNSAVTPAQIRSGLADDITSGILASVASRPSTMAVPTTFTLEANTTARPWINGFVR